MRIQKSKSVLLILAVSMFLSLVPTAALAIDETPTTNVPYVYPSKPNTPQWLAFTTHQEMVDACQIPVNALMQMSTPALVETVLNYPLNIDIYCGNDIQETFKTVSSHFNGYQELFSREDGASELVHAYEQLSSTPQSTLPSASIAEYQRLLLLEIILRDRAITENYSLINGTLASWPNYGPVATLYTPNASRVTAHINSEAPQEVIIAFNNEVLTTYPYATKISTATFKYNCHSYTFHSQSSSANGYWIGDPHPYWTDGSYLKRQAGRYVGDKLVYINDIGTAVHSAICVDTAGAVISKWGTMPLMQHNYTYCPSDYLKDATYSWFYRNPGGTK